MQGREIYSLVPHIELFIILIIKKTIVNQFGELFRLIYIKIAPNIGATIFSQEELHIPFILHDLDLQIDLLDELLIGLGLDEHIK